MGEVKIVDLPDAIIYTRRYIQALLRKGIMKSTDYILLCIAIAQYMAILYADMTRFPVVGKADYYSAFPVKLVPFLPLNHRNIAKYIATNRNLFCHSLGSPRSAYAMTEYAKYNSEIGDFVQDVILNDSLLQTDTIAAMN